MVGSPVGGDGQAWHGFAAAEAAGCVAPRVELRTRRIRIWQMSLPAGW